MFLKPTQADFILAFPPYAAQEYQEKLQEVMDEAFFLYREQIGFLPLDVQSLAFKLAVCHLFALSCWENMGYATPPQEISSRNDRVLFKGSVDGLNGTACGKKLLTLFRKTKPGYSHASTLGVSCHLNRGGCWYDSILPFRISIRLSAAYAVLKPTPRDRVIVR